MRLYVDLDLRLAVVAPVAAPLPLPSLAFTRGDTTTLEVQFVSGATVVDPAADTLFFCLKASGIFAGDALFLTTDFAKTGTGTSALWTATLVLDVDALTTAVGTLPQLLASAELGVISGGRITTVRPIRCIVDNDVYKGEEPVTEPYPARGVISFYPTITGLTGGTAADLDGQPTVNVVVGRTIQFVVGGLLGTFQLQAGTTAENGTSVIRPDDYNEATNAKIWVRLGSLA